MNNNDWETVDLSEIVEIKTGKLDSNAAVENGKYPFFTCSPETFKINEYAFDAEAILLAGNNANGVFPIKHYSGKFNAYQRTYVITVKNPSTLYLKYLYYQLSTQLSLLQEFSVGSATKFLTIRILNPLQIPLPSLPEQRAIAGILGALDDKIELNRRMNRTLESMARAVFRQWFVENEDVGDWEIGQLEEIATIKHGFAFKGEFFSAEETDNILLTPGNFKIGGGFNYSKFKYYDGEIPEEYVMKQGDLIVTMTDLSKEGDTLGYSAFVPSIGKKKILHNQRIGKVELLRDGYWKLYLYFLMQERDYRNFILSGASGTTVKHTSPTKIGDYKMLFPPPDELQSFNDIVSPIVELMEHNEEESRTLASLRDSLLPKLMRGEVRVKDMEKKL